MSKDNKTLADVQPGGAVRLGDQECAQGCDELRMRTDGERSAYLEGVAEGRRAALSAQPSPGGQDATVSDDMVQAFKAALARAQLPGKNRTYFLKDSELPSILREVLAAQPSTGGQGDARDMLRQFGQGGRLREGSRAVGHDGPDRNDWEDYIEVPVSVLDRIAAALAARQPVCGTCNATIQPDALTGTKCACSHPPTAWLIEWKNGVTALTKDPSEAEQHRGLRNCTVVPVYAARQPVASNQPSGNSGELDVDGARQPVGEPVCFISPIDASQLRSKDKTLRWTGTYWDRPGDDAVPVYLGSPAQAVDLGQIWQQAFDDTAHSYRRNKSRMWVLQMMKERVQELIDSHSAGGQP